MCLFSATVPDWVHKVAGKYMPNYKTIDLVGNSSVKVSPNFDFISLYF